MESRKVSAGGGAHAVLVDGAADAVAVLIIPERGQDPASYADICARLHNSGLRTVVLDSPEGLGQDDVVALLDELSLQWVNLVGAGAGATLAWQVAARNFGRVSSLVVIGEGHPAVAGASGVVADSTCPAVEVATTLLVGDRESISGAYASGRHVYSDYRVVELASSDADAATQSAELATEIVLRSSSW